MIFLDYRSRKRIWYRINHGFYAEKHNLLPKSGNYFDVWDAILKNYSNFAQKLVTMPLAEVKEKLKNLSRKMEILRKRYLALQAEKREMERTIECQQLEIDKLEKELAQMKIDNEFLRVAHTVPRDPEMVAQYKKQVAKMVRDIDRCIKQLNA